MHNGVALRRAPSAHVFLDSTDRVLYTCFVTELPVSSPVLYTRVISALLPVRVI